MKKTIRFAAVASGCILALSVLAGCGGEEEQPGDVTGATSYEGVRICYDNLPDDDVAIAASDTQAAVEGATDIKAYTFSGEAVANADAVATYANGVFTAKGAGIVTYKRDGKEGRVEVVPAYVTDPGHQYSKMSTDAKEDYDEAFLAHTHDPSYIEVMENGKPVYYLFSTGWDEHPKVEGYETYGNAIHRSEDLLTWKFMGRTFDWLDRDTQFLGSDAWAWLYDKDGDGVGDTVGYNDTKASWWAPDIVPAPDGGYWLYTCVVDGAGNSQGMSISGGNYARACILLYHSTSLEAGTFTAVKGKDGKQAVLMQSSIRRGESEADVNGIDPQIIYTPDGKMYMAYGSFGSGDYIIELDPATGLRKDGKGWQTHEEIRQYVDDIQDDWGSVGSDSIGWTHDYYGTNISKSNMEAPVIARHDNVKVFDETATFGADGEPTGVEGKTYYYSMHSYDGLGDNYQMYGGRSESVTGVYKSAGGSGIVRNVGPGQEANSGNKYMGAFAWSDKNAASKEIDIVLPGHNDLFTTGAGVHLAAYITRSPYLGSRGTDGAYAGKFVVQNHQYYLNSKGDICINANRYSGEMMRTVTKEELLKYTQDGKFKMVFTSNQRDATTDKYEPINVSTDVVLSEDGKIKSGTSEIGTWVMYGKCYIKLEFTNAQANGEKTYYGVVSPAWLGDQNKSGFTITALGYTNPNRSMSIFLNNYSTLSGDSLVG